MPKISFPIKVRVKAPWDRLKNWEYITKVWRNPKQLEKIWNLKHSWDKPERG